MKSLVQFLNEAKASTQVIEKFTELFGELGKVTIKNRIPRIDLDDHKNTTCVTIVFDKEDKTYFIATNPRKAQFVMGNGPSSSYFNRGRFFDGAKTPEELLDKLIDKKNSDEKMWNEIIKTIKSDNFATEDQDRFLNMASSFRK